MYREEAQSTVIGRIIFRSREFLLGLHHHVVHFSFQKRDSVYSLEREEARIFASRC